jgi:hypothetical protein
MKAAVGRGFSLVEVVMAVGIVATTLIVLLGLLASVANSSGELADSRALAEVGIGLEGELERLKTDLGLDALAALILPAGSATPLQLAATRDGRRVLRRDGPAPAADHPLDDPALPGIALRDRYFLIEVTQQPDLPSAPGAGFLSASARVTWPYRLPTGPATAAATSYSTDPSREVPATERRWEVVNYVVRP